MKSYPLKVRPVTKKTIWGGTYLSENFGIGEKDESIAEAWMLAVRPEGNNVIDNGEYCGMPLDEYIIQCGLKNVCGDFEAFPLLIKLIDANDRLSVQVHPDDAYAAENGLDAGKTEMWYVVDAKPGAKLVQGLKDSKKPAFGEIAKLNDSGKLDDILNYVDVKKGDCFYIPAGLVHAIGAGIVICEIQQNSNTTFRLYDYDRIGKDGKKRELHIEQAAEVIKTSFDEKFTVNKVTESSEGCNVTTLCDSKFFTVEKYDLHNGASYTFCREVMQSIVCLEGDGFITCLGEKYKIKKGDSYFVPKNCVNYSVCSGEKNLEIIISTAKSGE